jgi:hypothetical protein
MLIKGINETPNKTGLPTFSRVSNQNTEIYTWFADPLSVPLFSIVMDVIISKLKDRGNVSTRPKQILSQADDTVITGRTKWVVIDTFTKLKNEASKYGLLINENKMKYMKCTTKQVRGNKLEIHTMI